MKTIELGRHRIHHGDALNLVDVVEPGSVQCCVTSPPYWGLRDYGVEGQIGLEETPDEYVGRLVDVFRGVRKVLRADGVLMLNLGDSYAATTKGSGGVGKSTLAGPPKGQLFASRRFDITGAGLKPKDLVGIPWMVAFALRADGWWLRSEIIWAKPNPMPESVKDRPTKAHEQVFLLSKSAEYFWDADAIRERATGAAPGNKRAAKYATAYEVGHEEHRTAQGLERQRGGVDLRNARSVWSISPVPFDGAHFATMPPELARRCIVAGSRTGDLVCDPFAGAMTTAVAAHHAGRVFVGTELNAEYVEIGRARLDDATRQATLFECAP